MESTQARYIRQLFSQISPYYDRVNRVISLGQDRPWRRLAASLAEPKEGKVFLDLATGTGEMALELARKGSQVIALDLCPSMVARGMAKRQRLGQGRVQFLLGHCLALPFPESTFHGSTIGFALRDLPALPRVLQELYRVLRPGGKLVCLELTHPTSPLVSPLAQFYLFRLVPWMGRGLGGDREAYRYFPHSLVAFPRAAELAGMMKESGFTGVGYRQLGLGVAAVHWGCK